MLALLTADAQGQMSSFALGETTLLVGRRPECDVVLSDPTVSGRHAQLLGRGDHALVTDLGSTNGTWVNGKQVTQSRVTPGDELRFGHQVVQLMPAQGQAETGGARALTLRTGARLVVLQGMRPGTVFDLDKPIWTLGKMGGSRLVFVMRMNGWSVTLLDGSMPLKINGQDMPAMPTRLHDKDHIVYQGLALQFERV